MLHCTMNGVFSLLVVFDKKFSIFKYVGILNLMFYL